MKKIKSVFKRDYEGNRQVYDEVTPGCEWVLAGEGVATEKYDGSAMMIDQGGKPYKRYDVRRGKKAPSGAVPCQESPDPITGHWPHWVALSDDPADKWFWAAYNNTDGLRPGTYEAVGPHFQGNPLRLDFDQMWRHGDTPLFGLNRTFEGIKNYLKNHYIEGIVYHRGNGDMAKIKRVDFGFEWNGKKSKGGRRR